MNTRINSALVLTMTFGFMLVGYTNCGNFGADDLELLKPTVTKNSCEEKLIATFETTYRPFLTRSTACALCHTETGASPFKFASSDLSQAFNVFKQIGEDRVIQHALDATHAPGVTGPQNQAEIDEIAAVWGPAETLYDACNSSGTIGANDPEALRTTDRNTPELYFGDGKRVVLVWVLSGEDATPASARFPAVLIIDVAVRYEGEGDAKKAVGYSFANPRIQMLTGEIEVEVEGIIVRLNGTKLPGLEALASARKVARGIDPVILHDQEVSVTLPLISSSDTLSLSLGWFKTRPRTDNPPTPPTPTLAVRNAAGMTRQLQVPITIGNDMTARRWCLTTSTARPSSTAQACPGFESATTTGWLTARPANFDLATLGRPPVQGETIQFHLWVANSDLKISAAPASAQVIYDAQAPPAPAFGSITLNTDAATGMPVGEIVGLQDSTEPVSWCVKEESSEGGVQNADGCSFSATKPRYVGLRGSGNRYIALFARDGAGNTSPRSTIANVNNTLGRITYVQLAAAGGSARAVFANRCFACHGAGAPQQSLWEATSYASTVAKKAAILKKIEDAAAPMPPTGLLDEKERVLIRLWFNQTSTPVEQ